MVAAAIKHMASNFVKLDKFERVNFKRWQKKMHFLFSSMSVVYVLTTPIPEDGENATVDQIKRRAKWDNDDYAKYMAEDASSKSSLFTQHKMNMDDAIQVSCIIDKLPHSWKDFKHTLKHKKGKLTLVELGSHLCIEESLKVLDSDKPKGNNVSGPQLGHVHFKRMQDMSKDGLIPAFEMDTEKCKTCMLTKITKKPFQNVKRETEVLELVLLCLLHTKDEALDKFKVFKTEVKLQQGSLSKIFKTDKGGEYMDTLYFQSVGIIHETTTPYTS
ncbi:hypothetical protein Tco_1277250 [Tanacetum coccineum]